MENTAKKISQLIEKERVLEYLEENLDFFLEYEDLFEKMTFPRKKGGQVASFSDFQNTKLTHKIAKLEERTNRIMATAMQNIQSAQQINQLTLDLLHSTSKEMMMNHFRSIIEDELELDSAQIILKSEENISYKDLCINVFSKGKKVCLRTSNDENSSLHGGGNTSIQSEALIHLMNAKDESFGILTLGSRDKERFHEGQGVELLEFLGDVISYKLQEFMKRKA